MPFTIGEIPIGNVVDGELVLRDVAIDYGMQQITPMPTTPPRAVVPLDPLGRPIVNPSEGVPMPTTPPRAVVPLDPLGRPIVNPSEGVPALPVQPIPPQLPGGVRPPDYRTEAPKSPLPLPPIPDSNTPFVPVRPAPPAKTPVPIAYQPPDAPATTIQHLRDNLEKYNEYVTRAKDAAAQGRVDACNLFASVANSGESYWSAMLRNDMVPKSQLARERLPTTAPTRLDTGFCQKAAGIKTGETLTLPDYPIQQDATDTGKIWNPDSRPVETGKGEERFDPFDVTCADGTRDVSYGVAPPCMGHGGVAGEMTQIYDWKKCADKVMEAAKKLSPENMWIATQPMSATGRGGVTGSIVDAIMGVTQKSDIYQILASRKDGEEMSVNMGIAASDFVSATSLFESGSIDMAMEITARAMRALGAAISSAPDVMLQVDRGGIFEMDAGKFYLAWKYSLKVMREIEDSLAECFPGNPPREDRPDNDSGLSQLLSENCTTKAVPNGRGGSGTELITQCEQVIIDSNKWTGLSIGRP